MNKFCFLLIIILFYTACSSPGPVTKIGYPPPYKVFGKWYQPLPTAKNFSQKGIASWYGKKFHGKKTANGEIYNMHGMTAAHKTLPLGSLVRVENLASKREVVVRVNDRGPFVHGRIIDLSFTAAKKLGITVTGTALVMVTAIEKNYEKPQLPPVAKQNTPLKKAYSVQLAAFENMNNAARFQKKLSQKYLQSSFNIFYDRKKNVYKIRAGTFATLNKAVLAMKNLVNDGYTSAFVVED
jgi:rare lipoprotein A